MIIGTSYFVNFTKACDYYRSQGFDGTSSLLKAHVREKLDEGEIFLGKPEISFNETLVLIDNKARYGLKSVKNDAL